MNICLISDNDWVEDSLTKYLDFNFEFSRHDKIEEIVDNFDYIFVDMQINNNGGPSVINELKRKTTHKNSKFILLIDREADIFQAKRVSADGYLLKPFDKTNLKKLFI